MRRLGVAGGVLIVAAALALPACGGGSDSSAKASSTATTTVGQQAGGGSGGATTGTSATHGAATSTPHGTPTSKPHGTATSTQAATTTTRLNTIKPLPGRPQPPVFDYNLSRISSASPVTLNGTQYGVCRGPNHFTTVIVNWTTYNTDYVQLNQDHGNNYPSVGVDVFMSVPCDANHGVGTDPRAYVHFTLFGPGGETSADADIFVDRNYQP